MRVLICDDDLGIRTLLNSALSQEPDLEVVAHAGDGHEALRLAEQHVPDVVVLDLAMPRMDGLQALPKLREVVPHVRIVIFSGFQQSLLAELAKELGAAAVVEKGTDPSTLAETIRKVA